MTERTRPYLFYGATSALCAQCLRVVEAKDVIEDGSVFLLKRCREDGPQRVLLADDADYWRMARAERIAGELNILLPSVDRYDLRVANALWVDQSFRLVPAYVATMDRFYGRGCVSCLDIAGDTEAARQRINSWVEDHTNQRIKDLIPPGQLAQRTPLIIGNAVFFKGEWSRPFAASATRDEDFTLPSGERIKARMMHDAWRQSVPYAAFHGNGGFFATPAAVPAETARRPATYPDDDGFAVIELPYKGAELAMVVLLPRSPDGLAHLEGMLTAANLASWLGHLEQRTVDTAMPRFEQKCDFDVSGALQGMGMRRAFVNPAEADGAQFGGLSASRDPAQQLFLGSVLHKAWVEVTEKGTEAAAATAIMMLVGAAVRQTVTVPFVPVFRADHPFLFLIRDTKSGAILFLGRMLDPRA
jgi:serine protease inhibitor